ncbi:hypothetical protein NP233_g206 [Leucocoprinus birnbaumii]|uniref:F-box domain-containing protein n=1 Tax=Leucocoprinus birnbaumii TaxID=56174 RepID=A0AAD5W2S5_9AGAR|nr:hypothetical protein NP233_g206 [Leucocoprinus birnbaumii]
MFTSSQQAESDVLGADLAELDHEIDTLMTKRARIRYRYNQLRARTSVLPPETLSIIFQHVCDLQVSESTDLKDDRRPIAISSVSVHWREVARSTPAIWNRLCVRVKHADCASEGGFNLLKLYYKNSGNQLMDLQLSIREDDGLDDEENRPLGVLIRRNDPSVVDIFQFLLSDHPTKLRALFFNDFSLNWSYHFVGNIDRTIGLPNLERIHIGWSEDIEHDHDWAEPLYLATCLLPKLHDISLARAAPNFLIPHSQITDLHLEDIAIDYCVYVMNLCTSASECHIFYPLPPAEPDAEVPTAPVTLTKTTCLGWAFGMERWDLAFLTHYTFPSLLRFRYEDQSSDGLEDDFSITDQDLRLQQKNFLSRCPKLQVFERVADSFHNWNFNALRDDLPSHVEEIYLRRVEYGEAEAILRGLIRDSDASMETFPRLKALEIQGDFWNGLVHFLFPRLIKMLESRRRPLEEKYKDHFLLEEITLKWDPEPKERPSYLNDEQRIQLQEMVDKGLKVTTSSNLRSGERVWPTTQVVST